MPSDVAAISTTNLTKRYGAVTALAGINLAVPSGVTYGFLGPNGAGKTTTIRLLMGFIKATSGVARIWGRDCWHDGVHARADLGFLVPADALYPDMTGQSLLDYMAALSGKSPEFLTRTRSVIGPSELASASFSSVGESSLAAALPPAR